MSRLIDFGTSLTFLNKIANFRFLSRLVPGYFVHFYWKLCMNVISPVLNFQLSNIKLSLCDRDL